MQTKAFCSVFWTVYRALLQGLSSPGFSASYPWFGHTHHHITRIIIPNPLPESSHPTISDPSQTHPRPIPDQKYVYRMSHSLDEQSSTNYKEAFSLFDKRGTGRVSLESLGDLLRACGQNPTLAEISDLEKNLGGDFDFDAFSRVLSRPGGFRDPGEPEEYCRGFQVFDKDMTGVIGVGQLRYSMFFFFFL